MRWKILAMVACVGIGVPQAIAGDEVVTWFAGSGVTPEASGWVLSNSSGAPIVVDPAGMLVGPSSFAGLAGFAFDTQSIVSPGQAITLELVARVQQATYGNQSGFLRSGFSMFIADEVGRVASVEIGENTVALRVANTGLDSPTLSIDTTDQFRSYRLEMDNGTATLTVDGAGTLTAPVPVTGIADQSSAYFGDGTVLGSSTWESRSAVLSVGPAPCNGADLVAPFGVLNFFDVAEFIDRFNQGDPSTDLAEPFGVFNFFDVARYINLYTNGCI